MSYIPQIKEVNGKIHGAKRLARTPKHEKNNGYTTFVRCILFIEHKYNSQDLEKFIQFEHDAWNICDANGIHPIYHASMQRERFHKGLQRAIAEQENEFTIKWYTENVALMDRVINKACDHLDISDLDDNQVVRLVDMLVENHEQPWVAVARKNLIKQGLGITRFPKINNVEASIPMIVSRRARYCGKIAPIKDWLDDGVAHDPPNDVSGQGLMTVLEDLEHCPGSTVISSKAQIIEIVRSMCTAFRHGPGYNAARQMGRSQIEEICDMGIAATRHCTDDAIGLLDGITHSKPHKDNLPYQKKTFMKAIRGIQSHVSTNSAILMINLGSNILNSNEIQEAIDVVRSAYGRPEYAETASAQPMAERLVDGMFNSRTMNLRAMEIKAIIEQSRRLMHPENLAILDQTITRRLLASVVFLQTPSVMRALVDFLGEEKRINGCDPCIDTTLCSWKRTNVCGSFADTYVISELLSAMTRSGWTPSVYMPRTILEMVNTSISCAMPIIDLHLGNLSENGMMDVRELPVLFSKCLSEPQGDIDPATGYRGFYPWEPADRWTAKRRILDSLLSLCDKQGVDNKDVVVACDEAMKGVLQQQDSPSEMSIELLKHMIEACAWSYEKSADRVPAGCEHWLDEDSQEMLDAYMALLSHEDLVRNVRAAPTPQRHGPRF